MNVFIIGPIAGAVLYLTKLGLFMLLPKWFREFIHRWNITLIALDLVLSYSIFHIVSIAGGYLSLLVTMSFGACSMLYIYSHKVARDTRNWVKAWSS